MSQIASRASSSEAWWGGGGGGEGIGVDEWEGKGERLCVFDKT